MQESGAAAVRCKVQVVRRHVHGVAAWIRKSLVFRTLPRSSTSTAAPDCMDSHGTLLIMFRKIDMDLAPHFRHAVQTAALDSIRKILYFLALLAHRINIKVHPHTVSASFLHRCRNAHAENPRVLFLLPAQAFLSGKYVFVHQFSLFCMQVHGCDNCLNSVEQQRLPHAQTGTAADPPGAHLLRQNPFWFQHAVIMEEILHQGIVLPLQFRPILVIRSTKINLSTGVRDICHKVAAEMTAETAQEHPVAFFILEKHSWYFGSAGNLVQNVCLSIIRQHLLCHVEIGHSAIQETPAFLHTLPIFGIRKRIQVQVPDPLLLPG